MSFNLQRSPEWYNERLFRFTSSELHKLITEPKEKVKRDNGLLSKTAESYILDKICEIITNGTILDYKEIDTRETKWGQRYEPEAIRTYEKLTGLTVESCGFYCYSDYFGGSPDGLVGNDGIIEVKCPFNGTKHISNLLLRNPVDLLYQRVEAYIQIQGNLLASVRSWCDFISYDPRVQNERLRLKVIRVLRDEVMIDKITEKLDKANYYRIGIMDKLIEQIAK